MATPKTPRNRLDNPDQKTDAPKTLAQTPTPDSKPVQDTPRSMSTTTESAEDKVITLDEPVSAEAETVEPDVTAEDATSLDEPAPEQRATPEETIAPNAITAAPKVVKAGPGFVPLMLGGVVAAGLGFALARHGVPEGWPVPGASPLQAQLTQQAEEIESLRAALQALPQDDGTKAVLDELGTVRKTATAALETAEAAKLAATTMPGASPSEGLAPRLAALEDRLVAVESRPSTESGSFDPAILSQLTAEIETLRRGLEAQKTAAQAMVTEAEAVRSDAAAKAQSVLLQAALTKVEAAIQNGAPFTEPLRLLTDAGVAVPAILTDAAENGVPTTTTLADSFDEPARAALEESLRGNMGSTWPERVGSFLRAQTGARSLTPKEGDDPDAILSRANAAVAAGDIAAALTEIAALPEAAQTALSAWVEQAKLRLDAQAATVELATALSER